ncbi:MAG: efflux RND transporter periplasmic adaptor subunit [Saprospirales bacterium]|nr:efflux RND transporter periplasmic adaptor subunit [Saprospirales bacterium]
MRRINILYLMLPLVVWALLGIFHYLHRGTASFYGVAENQETQINLDHDLTVSRIYVSPGQFVPKGTLLVEVTRAALDLKLSDLSHDIRELHARDQLQVAALQGELQRLNAQRAEKQSAILARIRTLEAEKNLNQTLLRELKSIPVPDSIRAGADPYAVKLQTLHDELRLALAPLDADIYRLEQELRLGTLPVQAQLDNLKRATDLYQKEQERLSVYAPSDGLVGTVHCREGQNIQAFQTLISFYEQNPNTVVAYVHESLLLHIRMGDSLLVASSLRPSERCTGCVIGLGHRVVEIPERLRKIPEIKTYGREVLIGIPAHNNFLQKEKVLLQRLLPPPRIRSLSFLAF